MRKIDELCKLIKSSPKIIVDMNWADETDNFDIQRIYDIVLSLDDEELINSVTALILAEWNVLDSQDDPRCFHTLENGRKVSKFPNRNDYTHVPICIGFGPDPTVSPDSMSGFLYYCKVKVYNKLWPIWKQEKLRKQLMETLSPSSEKQKRIATHDDIDEDFENHSDVITKEESFQNNNDAIEKDRAKIPELEYDEETETLYLCGKQEKDNSIKVNKTKMGRPNAKEFKDYIKRDTPICFLTILTEMLAGKKGKEAAQIIKACIGYWIDEPQFKSVTTEFESIKPGAYREAMKNPSNFPDGIIKSIREDIQKKIDERTKKELEKQTKNRHK
jgi:hypothetical protein